MNEEAVPVLGWMFLARTHMHFTTNHELHVFNSSRQSYTFCSSLSECEVLTVL